MNLCNEKNIPCILINPELINMDQGFGVRARNIRKNILSTFAVAYKLITLEKGAIVREWPRGFTVWIEDQEKDEGYSVLKCFSDDPPRETVADLFEVYTYQSLMTYNVSADLYLIQDAEDKEGEDSKKEKNIASKAISGMVGFFQGLSKL